jgi:hypothetical protein
MATLTYCPEPGDNDETSSGGVDFKAYVPVEVDNKRHELIIKLSRNAWFTAGEPDPARKAAWERVRLAQAAAKTHRDHADHIEKHPETHIHLKSAPAATVSAPSAHQTVAHNTKKKH